MPRALLYLLFHHMVGSWRFRLKRLKQPKYLLGMLAVLGYFYFLFAGSWASATRRQDITQPEFVGLMVGLFLVFQFSLIWLLAGRFTGLGFSEAETEILFAAPLTRKELIRYRLLKSQAGVVFSALFLVVILSLSWRFPAPVLTFLAAFVLLNIVQAFQLLTAVVHGFWQDRWWSGLIKLLGIALLVTPVLLAAPLEASPKGPIGSLLIWAKTVTQMDVGWLSFHVWLGQFLVVASPIEWLLRLAVCVVWFVLLYQLIVWFDFGFEEKEIAQAHKQASTLKALRQGRGAVKEQPFKRSLLPLAWAGAPWRAIAWKNITSLSRHLPRGFLFAVFYILFIGVIFFIVSGPRVQPLLGGAVILAVIAFFLTLMGSSMLKEDLRSDLNKLDILRAFPIPAHEIIRGEIFGAFFAMYSMVLLLLGGSMLLLLWAGSLGLHPFTVLLDTGLLGLLLAGVLLLSFTIENALALFFPAWLLPEAESAQQHVSIDQMGRSIILVIARFFLLSLLLIPPSLWLVLTLQSALILKNPLLMGISAAGFSVIAWGETEIIILWLAHLLERLDASQEGL